MVRDDFKRECLASWTAAVTKTCGKNPPVSATWQGLERIHDTLRPFMGSNRNHALMPTGGGHDLEGVDYSFESECLELVIGDKRVDVVKPGSLTFEYFPDSPIDSFLLLHLTQLQRMGVYDRPVRHSEYVLELAPGEYVDADVEDRGFLRYDERGHEVPLPASRRLVTRWLGGKVLIVSKTSRWNGDPGTYDGRHNTMQAADIRGIIERSLHEHPPGLACLRTAPC